MSTHILAFHEGLEYEQHPWWCEACQEYFERDSCHFNAGRASAFVDLNERLERAEQEIDGLVRSSSMRETTDHFRLKGKVEGVRLALSYVHEMWRQAP